MKLKSRCCEKYQRKAKLCGKCPLRAKLSKKARRKKLRKVKKRLDRAA